MKANRRTMLAMLCPIMLTSAAAADYTGVEMEEDAYGLDGMTPLSSLGLGHLRVINVYATFDDPDDQVLMVFGAPGDPFNVVTFDGTGFYNVPGSDGGGKRSPKWENLSDNSKLHADSFMTVGNRIREVGPAWSNGDTFADRMYLLPGTPGPDDPWGDRPEDMAWLAPATTPPPSGGPIEPVPQTIAGNWNDNRVLIMRLAVRDGEGVIGSFGLMVREDGQVAEVSGSFVYEPPVHAGESEGDQLGRAVANAGDVDHDGIDDFIVGAPQNADAGSDAGKAYVYSGSTQELLYARTGQSAGDRFGWSVAGAGDVNDDGYDDFVVGARGGDGDSGYVDVYSGVDGGLLYRKTGESAGDRFGNAVTGGIDVNNDGTDDFIVGAPFNDGAGSDSGRVYVFSGSGEQLYTVSGAAPGDRFGFSVSSLGNADGDAYDDFVVGAPHNDDGGSNAGRAYACAGVDGSVIYAKRGQNANDHFGHSVAGVGRVDDDARDDFAVGAPDADDGSESKAGRVAVYRSSDGKKIWIKFGKNAGDRFGTSVAGVGDLNGDGRADIAVGAPKFDGGGSNAGRVYVKSGQGGANLMRYDGVAPGDQFGHAVAGLGQVDGQLAAMIIGAPKNDDHHGNSGRAHLR